MYLSREEEGIYQGERGETLRRMMEILVALGDIFGAERLVSVRSVQIAGVSYKNIGEAGLKWISDLQGRVVVPSILNPAGMDLCRLLCQLGHWDAHQPRGRAVCPGGSAGGKTALYGYHQDDNQLPTHLVEVEADLRGSDYGALGFLMGKVVKDGVPFFRLKGQRPVPDELKALGAAMAASGSVALYYVENVTPEPPGPWQPVETICLGRKEIDEVYSQYTGEGANVVALGCPHCSGQELEKIAGLLKGQKVLIFSG
ncbi:MAG: aconitase X [Methanothrix sp.]|nr:aconitase X [Methanothrix sp.]